MHVYCVKRPDIVKEILMFALWSWESKMFGKWILIYTLDVTKFKFIILSVDSVNVQVPNQILKYKLDKTEDLDGVCDKKFFGRTTVKIYPNFL